MNEKRHPGITMHKLSVGSGFIGIVFTVGCALIFLLGLPELWYFVAFSALFGVALAVVFRVISNRRAQRMKPISILQTIDVPKPDAPKPPSPPLARSVPVRCPA